MIYKKINLKDVYKNLKFDAILTAYCQDNTPEIDINRKKQTILCFPGGGYCWVSARENEPIALRFLGFDFNVFTLKYTIYPNTDFPYPLIEAIAAIDYIYNHADEFNVDKTKISVMGFSAGAHLAGCLAAHKDDEIFYKDLGIKNSNCKLYSCILGYPVVTSDYSFAHKGSIECITKKDPARLKEYFSLEKNITNNFPRTFVYSFEEDPVVPIKNTQVLVEALKQNNVEVECHIYHGVNHGASLGDRSVYGDSFDLSEIASCAEWVNLAINFLRKY